MAQITAATLTITHDHTKKTARPLVSCTVSFSHLDLCLMRACTGGRMFKLKCQLWGDDSGLTGSDDHLYTYGTVYYFPDVTPSATETRTFDVTLGEGVLDEDGLAGGFTDEVYGKLILRNLFTNVEVTKKTNVVSHRF